MNPDFRAQRPACAALRRAIAGFVAALAAAGALRAEEKVPIEAISDGLHYLRYEVGGVLAHVLKLDMAQKGLNVRSLKADGKETLQSMVGRLNDAGERVIAAVNGDFFDPASKAGVPYGIQVSDGKLVFGPRKRSIIAFDAENKPSIGVVSFKGQVEIDSLKRRKVDIDGVNVREAEMGGRSGVYLYTPAFQKLAIERFIGILAAVDRVKPSLQVGEACEGVFGRVIVGGGETVDVPAGGCLIYFTGEYAKTLKDDVKSGNRVSIRLSLPPIRGAVPQAIGGGPRLVRGGRKSVEFDKEDFDKLHVIEIDKKPHPRTAVGYDRARKHLFLAVVEGRQKGILGMTMDELAEFMVRVGCYDAMALDGGGSAAMYVLGRGIVSTSIGSGGAPEDRQIANALLISRGNPVEVKKPPIVPGEDAQKE